MKYFISGLLKSQHGVISPTDIFETRKISFNPYPSKAKIEH